MATYEFVDVEAIDALVRTATCSHADLGPVITGLFGEIIEANSSANLVAPPRVIYAGWRESDCDIEVAMPVESGTVPAGGSLLKTYPACSAVMAMHQGPYEGLSQAWLNLWTHVTENGIQADGAPWDSYEVGPDTEPNPENWLTGIFIPLKKI
jgi:effector-binding domain-containing protein